MHVETAVLLPASTSICEKPLYRISIRLLTEPLLSKEKTEILGTCDLCHIPQWTLHIFL